MCLFAYNKTCSKEILSQEKGLKWDSRLDMQLSEEKAHPETAVQAIEGPFMTAVANVTSLE